MKRIEKSWREREAKNPELKLFNAKIMQIYSTKQVRFTELIP